MNRQLTSHGLAYDQIMKLFSSVLALAFVALLPVQAASPRDELLRLVPEDVAFCLVVEDLRGHVAAFLKSPFYRQFRQSPLVETFLKNAPELEKLAEFDAFLQQHLHTSLQELRDELIGDAVVLAYRPGPPGKPEEEQGLVLVRARDAAKLARWRELLHQFHLASGQIKQIETRSHHGVQYFREVDGKQINFYCVHGPILAISAQEPLLCAAIDRLRTTEPVRVAPVVNCFRELGMQGRLVSLWVNPRAFDAELQQRLAAVQGAEAAALRTLWTYWQGLDGVGVSLGLETDLRLGLTVQARSDVWPIAARQFLTTAAEPSELWNHFPEDALLAFAGRFDLLSVLEVLGQFLDDDARQGLLNALNPGGESRATLNMIRDLLSGLGPDVGGCILAPPSDQAAWFPHVLIALRTGPGKGPVPTDLAVSGALNALVLLATLDHNRKHPGTLQLRAENCDGIEIKYLLGEKQFPAGLRPAFALKNGYLVLASSPEALRRFDKRRGSRQVGNGIPLLSCSLTRLRQFLQARRFFIIEQAVAQNGLTREEAIRQWDTFSQMLQLIDRLELTQQTMAGQVSFTLQARTALPLR